LAEQTSPDDYKINNVTPHNELGATWASFDAVLHSFDVLNRNRRMYDGNNVWTCIKTSDRIQDGLRKSGWFGEMDHPGQNFTNMALTAERVQKIDMGNRSHKIINPQLKGNLLIARIETCAGTEVGIGMARDIIQGLIPSFSCRSIAVMKYRNGKPYVEVKKIITYDWVLYPSHKEAEMITKPEIYNDRQKVVLESADMNMTSTFMEYSKDFYVPMTEFADFKDLLANSDGNVEAVLESCDYAVDDITGFDPATGNLIIENSGNVLFVNTNRNTKKKVEDFLLSYRG
jgi:uncharacterized protein YozE (UPF0346 family)